ncbi:hypothetical protein Bca52824_092079 [Brassica carinata]|uniref:Uncharacterized protein n=1 Tax=Brassica carinata TaxID=52824 RepID=A0A8X7NTD4_BRACI|nr:hypothetical protein Bca52824_092079 [Brassica carinata]
MSAPVLSVLDIRLGRLRRALHEGDGGFSPGVFPALFDLLLLSVQLILGPSSNEIRRRVPVPVCSGGSPIKLPAVAFQSVKVVEALVGTCPSIPSFQHVAKSRHRVFPWALLSLGPLLKSVVVARVFF